MHLLIPIQESQTRNLNFVILKGETIIELNRGLGMEQIPKRIRDLPTHEFPYRASPVDNPNQAD